jgi:hypothetical protein
MTRPRVPLVPHLGGRKNLVRGVIRFATRPIELVPARALAF